MLVIGEVEGAAEKEDEEEESVGEETKRTEKSSKSGGISARTMTKNKSILIKDLE